MHSDALLGLGTGQRVWLRWRWWRGLMLLWRLEGVICLGVFLLDCGPLHQGCERVWACWRLGPPLVQFGEVFQRLFLFGSLCDGWLFLE